MITNTFIVFKNILKPFKNYINRIEIANNYKIFVIRVLKPFIYLYDFYFKYWSNDNIID